MPIINVLDKSIYNRISAGEVVERPASVVKELVENSIDAKATNIKIKICGGGIDKIEVFDNGSGIEKEDLKTALLPHATSKISTKNDLENISTLGFRGEALPSIASVAEIEINSKKANCDIGYTITSFNGETSDVEEINCNDGTFITVSNLFYNVPARRKFLKTPKGEENEVSDMVLRLILANPEIAFEYVVDGVEVYKTFGDGVVDAILSCYGNEYFKNSFKISSYVHGVKIEGYISKHNFTKSNRSYQTVILNGRYIVNQTIQSAIHNAYAGYLMKRRYPFYVLYITLPSEVVDVNVNPNKSDVRFADNSVVYGAIYSTISKVLDGTDSALDIVSSGENLFKSPNAVFEEFKREKEESLNNAKKPLTKLNKYEKDDFTDYFGRKTLVAEDEKVYEESSQQDRSPQPEIDVFSENKKYIEELEKLKQQEQYEQIKLQSKLELNYVGQVLNSYLIFEGGGDMYIVDQHAAHERLLYNKILNLYYLKEFTVQPMLVPFEFSLNGKEQEYFSTKIDLVKDLGFEISKNGNKYVVNAVPLELVDVNLEEFFMDIISDFSLRNENVPEIINEKLIQKACKSAVKANMPLSEMEVNSLIRLLNGNINLKCPHGRPIAVKITKYEIDKWFKRIV